MRFYAGPAYVVRDELGYLPLPAEAASALFQVSIRGILKSSKIVTTNRSISECGQVLGDTTVAAALLARHGCSGQVPAKAAVIARQYSVGRCPVVRLTARPGRLSAPTPTGPRWVRKSRPGVGMMCPSSYQQADYIAFWAVSLSLTVVCQSAGPTRAGGSATLERSTISISSPHGVRK